MRRQIVTLGALLLSLLVACSSPQQPAPPEPAPAPTPAPEPSSAVFTPSVIFRNSAPEAEAQIQTFAFADPQHGWIAIDDQILATADGGTTWTDLGHVGTKITALDLVTPTTGWVGTGKGIYVPAKDGKGWEQIDTGIVADLDFIDITHGWALMNYGLWQTSDGGRHWAPLPSSCGGATTARLSFTSASSGWLLCGGQGGTGMQGKDLLHSTDGGKSWQVIAHSSGPGEPPGSANLPRNGYVSDLFFLDDQHGWISFARGSVLSTTDGGQTWTGGAGGIEIDAVTPSTLRFFTVTDGLLLLRGGGIHATEDGGRTWSPLYPRLRPNSRLPLQMLSPTQWVTVGRMNDSGAILWSTNAGQDWQQVASLGTPVRALAFIDPTHGWALNHEGRPYRTSDGGRTWQPLPAPPKGGEEQFFRLQFFSQDRGYAISGWGHIYETVDGGQSFTPVNREDWTSETRFITPELGWRTKDFTLYATGNGGKDWRALGLETRVVDFVLTSAQTGWVVGGELVEGTHQPALFGTKDGGEHWTRYDLPGVKVAALRFADPAHGLLIDQADRLFITSDGGQSWTELP